MVFTLATRQAEADSLATLPSVRYFRMLTARAMTSTRVMTEMRDCVSIVSLAQRVMGIASVGLNAIAFVNDT
jgi:hypothetical protein